jgi:hypothetical protein
LPLEIQASDPYIRDVLKRTSSLTGEKAFPIPITGLFFATKNPGTG